jgi:2-(3-amino-3-carboxypropyl)histidine synthase
MLDPERILAVAKEKGPKSIGLQYPEGLRREVVEIADRLQEEGYEVVLSGDPCFGACDISDMPVDLIIHFGHSPIGVGNENIHYEEVRIDCKLDVLDDCVPLLSSPVGLVTNVQHAHQLPEIEKYLEGRGLKVLVGEGDKRVKYRGQVLGCDFSAARSISSDAKSFLYFGGGSFHPLGVALATKVEVVAVDPFTNNVMSMADLREKFLRQRFAAIELASKAEKLGILVSSKSGQTRMKLAKRLNEGLARAGKKGFVILLDGIVPENLEGYGMDAFVSTACSRIAVDDYMRFKKPIINPKELEIALGERSWNDYEMDEF